MQSYKKKSAVVRGTETTVFDTSRTSVQTTLKNGVSTFLKSLIFQYNFDFIGLQETMVEDCEVSLLRKFDIHEDYLWEWIPSKDRSRGILVGICLNRYDVGSFTQGEFMIQMNLWDKILKVKWNLLVLYGAA